MFLIWLFGDGFSIFFNVVSYLSFLVSKTQNLVFFLATLHTIQVWYIYLHLVDFYGFHVGKYTVRPMDGSFVGENQLKKAPKIVQVSG